MVNDERSGVYGSAPQRSETDVPDVAIHRVCSFGGCERRVSARGLCHGHYMQDYRGNGLTRLKQDIPDEERFREHFDARGDGCWRWQGSISRLGYGVFHAGGRPLKAHRYAYELAFGPIPRGLEIDHQCRTRACVNPRHLLAVTRKQNVENQGISPRNTSGFRGVTWSKAKSRWEAVVRHKGVTHYLGAFDDVVEAAEAARKMRCDLFTNNLDDYEPSAAKSLASLK